MICHRDFSGALGLSAGKILPKPFVKSLCVMRECLDKISCQDCRKNGALPRNSKDVICYGSPASQGKSYGKDYR